MNTGFNYLNDLNEMQHKAVEYCDGPSLVIASAGSGKTRVLTYKIAHLLNLGYEPWSILALTFTNKAANVMKERIEKLIGEGSARYIWMGTFHSIFLRILRNECLSIDFQPNFTIYDQSSSESLVKTIIKESELDDKVYNHKTILSKISNIKSRLITPASYSSNSTYLQQDRISQTPMFHVIYQKYCERCKLANAMDFDDILIFTFTLFNEHPEIKEKYSSRFKYILVDEYQDTNFVQHAIVYQLSSTNNKLCVVGDDSQSIYSFRGANLTNILKFNQVYPESKLFKLEQNYRSTQTIVDAANSVISQNKNKIDKTAFSKNERGDKLCLYEATSDIEEGFYVANRIVKLHEMQHLDYSSFAILYRTNAQSRVFEEALRNKSLPYIVYGGLSFYQRKEIKDVISYFRLIVNHNDEEAFKRSVNYPKRGIGLTTINKIIDCAVVSGQGVWDVLSDIQNFDIKISNSTLQKILGFIDMIEGFTSMMSEKNIFELAQLVIQQSGIMRDLYSDMSVEGKARQENLEELINAIKTFVETRTEEDNEYIYLEDYLSEVALLSDIDATNDDGNSIKLMTVHSAKGLEFNTVFVAGMEENIFPSIRSGSLKELEEERRLFYVALTRAEKRCYLTYAKSRYRYGKTEFSTASRFLKEINTKYVNIVNGSDKSQSANRGYKQRDFSWLTRLTQKREEINNKRKTSTSSSPSYGKRLTRVDQPVTSASHTNSIEHNQIYDLSVGDQILHDRFGKGVVEKLEGTDIQCKASVNFEQFGTKQLLLKFAKFKKL